MNKYVALLMKDNDLGVEEKFNIIGIDYEKISYNPYHFNKNGNLIDCDHDEAHTALYCLINGEYQVEKMEVLPKLTEIEEKFLEICSSLEYNYIARTGNDGSIFIYHTMECFERKNWSVSCEDEEIRIRVDNEALFNSIKSNHAYTIYELLGGQ